MEFDFGCVDVAKMKQAPLAIHLPRNETEYAMQKGFVVPVPELSFVVRPAVSDVSNIVSQIGFCFKFMSDDIKQNRTANIDNNGTVNPSVVSYKFVNVLAHDRMLEGVSGLKLMFVLIGMLHGTCRRLVDSKRGFVVLNVVCYRCVSFGHSGNWIEAEVRFLGPSLHTHNTFHQGD